MIINLVYLIFGLLTPFAFHYFGHWLNEKFGLVFSPASDVVAFGKPSGDIAKDNPSALVIKTTVYDMFSGLYLAVAVLHFCLVWFGLMRGQDWSIWALTFSDLAIIAFFLLAARNFSVHLAPLGWRDLMPFTMVPGIILPFATVLGFIGIYYK